MPKAFSQPERDRVRAALMAAGARRFAREGLRAVRIGDLSADAGIAKGSFYAFFASKEELFMEIADEGEARHRADMRAALDRVEGDAAGRVGGFFDMIMDKIETDPMLAVLTDPGTLAALMRRLPAGRIEANYASDRAFTAEMAELWNESGFGPPVEAGRLLALMSLMLCLYLQKPLMTEPNYSETRAELRSLFVMRLAGVAA